MKTKCPVHMVFGLVTCNGGIMPPFFFPHGLRLNIEAYIRCLGEVLLLWIEKVATKDLLSRNSTLHYGTQAGEPGLSC